MMDLEHMLMIPITRADGLDRIVGGFCLGWHGLIYIHDEAKINYYCCCKQMDNPKQTPFPCFGIILPFVLGACERVCLVKLLI